MKLSILLLYMLVAFSVIIFPSSVFAAGDCQLIYGGGEVCLPYLSITKLVQKPATTEFVKNLSESDALYMPESFVTFKIVVKNLSSDALQNIEVTDTLPQFLHFIAGPGSFDPTNKTLTFILGKIEKQETQEFDITTQVTSENLLPKEKQPYCMTNSVKATEGAKSSSDASMLCVETKETVKPTAGTTQVLGVTSAQTTPATGGTFLSVIALLPAAVAGFLMRKRS